MGGGRLQVEELQRLLTPWKLSRNAAHLPSSLEGSNLDHPSDFGHPIYTCTHRHRPDHHPTHLEAEGQERC